MEIIDLAKTPGYIYGAGYCMGAILYSLFQKKRFSLMKTILFDIGLIIVLEGWMYFTRDIKKYLFMPCVFVTLFIMILFQYLICKNSLQKAVFYAFLAFLIGEFSASLEWQLYYFIVQHFEISVNVFNMYGFMSIIFLTVFVAFFILEKYFSHKNVEIMIHWRDSISVVLIVGSVFCTSNISYVFENTPFSSQSTSEIFIIRTLVDLGGIFLIYAYHAQMQEMNMQIEIKTLQNLLQSQYQNYKVSEDSVAMVNQKYHDLKHQIEFLKEEITQEEKLLYLNQMEQEIKRYETQNKTGNNILDTILTAKSFQCQNLDIKMTCVADGALLCFMNPMDINSLFGNALENAIECVQKIGSKEKRLIQISVARQKDFLSVCIANTCIENLEFQQGIPLTSKKDKRYHGFGVKSIQNTVNKYEGSMNIHFENNWFELRILIPLSDDKII